MELSEAPDLEIANLRLQFLNQQKDQTISQLLAKNFKLRKSIKRLRNDKLSQTKKLDKSFRKSSLCKVFNGDQLSVIYRPKAKYCNWSVSSVAKALKVRAAGGRKALNQVRTELGVPLPSITTINRRLRNLDFNSGNLTDFLELKKKKVPKMARLDRNCALSSDAIHIVPGQEIDPSTKQLIGSARFPGCTGDASCAIVFMLCGTRKRWKETISYYFAGNGITGVNMKCVLFDIVEKCESIGLFVNSMTFDQGSDNTGVLSELEIKASPDGIIKNFITHPCDPNRKFYIFCDVPHVFKNIANGLRTYKKIVIPPSIVQKFNLTSNVVDIEHIKYLKNLDDKSDIKFAPRLKEKCINPKQYEKMRVQNSFNLLNNHVQLVYLR